MRLTQDSPSAQTPHVAPPEPIAHAANKSDTLNYTQTLTVNREQLTHVYTKARFVARRLSNVENLCEFDMEAIDDLCRSLFQATQILNEMLDR